MLREEFRQFTHLTGHFFGRLFRNETVDFEDQMKERLIVALSALAVIFLWSTNTLLFKYQFTPDVNRSWQEKNYIFTLMMILFGIITVLEWDVLFPDRQDFLNLTPLPIRLRTIFAAKMASFVLFIGLFSVAMTGTASILFSIYLTEWRANSLILAGRYVLSHVLSGFAANFAVFFAFVFLQFFLMAALPIRIYRSVSMLVRFGLVAALVFLLLCFMVAPGLLGESFQSLERLKDIRDPFVFRFPPLWFVGLYEVILGTTDPVFLAQAGTAALAILVSLLSFFSAAALSYRRHHRKTLEMNRGGRFLQGPRDALGLVFSRVFLRRPEERAVFGFFSATLRSSAKHRMNLAYYLAIGSAMILLMLIGYRDRFQLLTPDNGFLLSIPIILVFVILAGIRSLVNIPASPGANWIFRVTETSDSMSYASGVKKAVFFRWVLPLFGGVLGLHAWLWDWRPALLHTGFGLLISLVGLEAFFFRYRKVPFACTYLPGKAKLHFWGPLYGLLFIVLMIFLANAERSIFRSPSRFVLFGAATAVVLAVFRAVNSRFYARSALIYEEEPEPALVTLS